MTPPTPLNSSVAPMRSGATACTLRAKKLRRSSLGIEASRSETAQPAWRKIMLGRQTCCRRPRASGDPYSRGGGYRSPLARGRQLVLLSQKVAADGEENHLFGKTHTSAMGGWNGSAEIKR